MTHKRLALAALITLLMLPAALSVQAQTRIEVKDGKVYVNGEFVKELEASEGGVYFLNDDDPSHPFSIMSRYRDHMADVDVERLQSHAMRLSQNVLSSTAPLLERQAAAELRGLFPDREVMRMEAESRELARKHRTDPSDAAATEAELRTLLTDIFDRKIELQEKRIASLREELQSLETRLQERQDARQQVIDRRVQELLGRKDVLDW